jgi:hypothetical protein
MWKDWLERTLNRRASVSAPVPSGRAESAAVVLSHALTGEITLPPPPANEDEAEDGLEYAHAQ